MDKPEDFRVFSDDELARMYNSSEIGYDDVVADGGYEALGDQDEDNDFFSDEDVDYVEDEDPYQ